MAVKLRLMRMGKKKQPFYRVVVADSRSPRDGRFIEILGTYDPRAEPSKVVIDNGKALRWLRDGAKPTERVARLLTDSGAMDEFKIQVVSTTDDIGVDDDWDDQGHIDGGRAGAVLQLVASKLVDEPEQIRIDTSETRNGIKLSLRVAAVDMGKVIGRRGRVAQSIRSVVRAAGAKEGVDVIVDIVD